MRTRRWPSREAIVGSSASEGLVKVGYPELKAVSCPAAAQRPMMARGSPSPARVAVDVRTLDSDQRARTIHAVTASRDHVDVAGHPTGPLHDGSRLQPDSRFRSSNEEVRWRHWEAILRVGLASCSNRVISTRAPGR